MARNFKDLKQTVTVTRPVPTHLSDMLSFVAYLEENYGARILLSDLELLSAAEAFYDRQHGED